MLFYKQNTKTHVLFSNAPTYIHISRSRAMELFRTFNSLSAALENIEISISRDLNVMPEGDFRNSVDRFYQLCSSMNSNIFHVSEALGAYLRASQTLEQQQRGFIKDQVAKARDRAIKFPWDDIENTMTRMKDEGAVYDCQSFVCSFEPIAKMFLESLAKFYSDFNHDEVT